MANNIPITAKIKLIQDYIYHKKGTSVKIVYPIDMRQLDMLNYAYMIAYKNYQDKK
jgi:hypothetical protein